MVWVEVIQVVDGNAHFVEERSSWNLCLLNKLVPLAFQNVGWTISLISNWKDSCRIVFTTDPFISSERGIIFPPVKISHYFLFGIIKGLTFRQIYNSPKKEEFLQSFILIWHSAIFVGISITVFHFTQNMHLKLLPHVFFCCVYR